MHIHVYINVYIYEHIKYMLTLGVAQLWSKYVTYA